MRVLWVTFAVLVLDQITKVLVKTNMYLGQSIPLLGDWLKLTFTENPGMAFGVTFGVPMLVTIFAMLATIAIMVYLWHARRSMFAYRLSLAFVLGGAIGNIIDRVLYGKIFGYAGLFRGEVVDFIHINVYNGPAASWLPFLGGKHITLFPIWNVADMAIVCGVVAILLFHRAIAAHYERQGLEYEGVLPIPPAHLNSLGDTQSASPAELVPVDVGASQEPDSEPVGSERPAVPGASDNDHDRPGV